MKIEFTTGALDSVGDAASAVALLTWEQQLESGLLGAADRLTGGAVARALAAGRFKGARDEVLELLAPTGLRAARLVLVGGGLRDQADDIAIEHAAARAFRAVQTSGVTALAVICSELTARQAAHAALGVLLGSYRFDRYRTKEKPQDKPSVATVQIVVADVQATRAEFSSLAAVAEAVRYTRDLVSEPPNVLYPAEFARRVKELTRLGLEVEVLGEQQMTELKMAALLSVGQGSRRESQLVIIRWNGGPAGQAPLAFVGKGVCFDTGGVSLKAAKNMDSMKWDMGGAAAVAGILHALAGRKAKVNAVGILALVENMPDGNAQRPGDVITSMSGQTIEIISTDAEGRVILSDALWYCHTRFQPRVMVDLATLTGASQTALGFEYAALFSNAEEVVAQLIAAGKAEDELLWQLPLSRRMEKQLESPVADLKNLGESHGGAITAALFLERFVAKTRWAHLDITPTVWSSPSPVATIPDGASGFGVRLLNRWVADNYER